MEGLWTDVISPLVEGIADESAVQKKLTVLASVGEQCGLNSALLLSALSTLSKLPNARSTMDAEIIDQLKPGQTVFWVDPPLRVLSTGRLQPLTAKEAFGLIVDCCEKLPGGKKFIKAVEHLDL